MIAAVSLTMLVQLCAPRVAPNTALAIISVESGGHPWEIDDDTARRSYSFRTYGEAVIKAQELLDEGHNLDVGLMQVNSDNFSRYGMNVAQVFDPCTNVSIGADILTRAYHEAARLYGTGEVALYHAFQIYNSGRASGAPKYARLVWEAGNGF